MKKLLLPLLLILTTTFSFAQFPNLVASSNSPVCSGNTLSLQATHDALPSGTTVEYSWSGGNAFSSTLQNPQITNANSVAGIYTVTAIFSGNYVGTHTATTSVSIPNQPSLSIRSYLPTDIANSTSSFCVGNDMTLEGTTSFSSGVSFSWAGPNGFTSNLPNPTITNLSIAHIGTYQLTGVFNNSSCAVTLKRQIEITVGTPKISLSSNGTCAGGNVTITPLIQPSSATPSAYYWEGPNNFTSNDNALIINNLQEFKTYKLTAQFGGNCAGTAIAYTTISPNVPSPNISSTANNCNVTINASLSSTASSFTNYSWTGPNGFSSSLLVSSITVAGDYTFTGTISGGGCNDIFTRTITVPRIPSNSSPILSLNLFAVSDYSVSQNTFCDGSNVYLLKTVGGDQMSQMTYNWTGPNGFSSTLSSPMISNFNATKAGIYTLVATGIGNACSPSATATVTNTIFIGQNTAPTISISRLNSANSGIICSGNKVTFSANYNSNGLNSIGTYSWAGPNGFTSNLRTPEINNISAANEGIYTVTASVTSGCVGTLTATTNLTLANSPNLNINTRRLKFTNSITNLNCLGSTVELVPNTSGIINSISWTGPNGFSSSDVNPKITNATAANTGQYFAAAVLGGECPGTVSTTTTFTFSNSQVIPLSISRQNIDPIGDNRSICVGSNIKLVAIPSTSQYNQATYLWSGPNGFTSTEIAPTLSSIQAANFGTYSLTATFNEGCSGTASTSIAINSSPPSVNINKLYNFGTSNTVCSGNVVSLEALNTISTDTYSWAGPNGFTSTSQKIIFPTVSVNDAGTYTLTTTIGGSCSATVTATSNITIGDVLPTGAFINFREQSSNISSSSHCLGANIILSSGISVSSNITITSNAWSGPNGFSSNLVSPVLTNTQTTNAGVYTVTLGYLLPCGTAGTITATANLSFTKSFFISSRKQGGNNSSTYCPTTNIELYVTSMNPSYAQITSYSWAGPNGFSSTAATPLISNSVAANSGVYTLTVTNGSPCPGTSSATLSINIGNPSASAYARRPGQSSNANVFCAGSTVELFTSINASEPTVSSYNWTGPNGFSSTAALPQITNWQAANAGNYILSLVLGGACAGTYTSSTYLSEGRGNAFISSNPSTSQCLGGNITLFSYNYNSSYGTGTTYSWTGPNNFSSTAQSVTLTNLQAINSGIYTVTTNYPFTSGCASSGTSTATTGLTIGTPLTSIQSKNQGAAFNTSQFCTGNNIELSTSFGGISPAPIVSSYSWTGPNGFTSNSATPLISNFQTAKSGVYSVTVIFSGACAGTATATTQLSISIPSVGTSSYLIGSTPEYGTSSYCPSSSVEFRALPFSHLSSSVTYSWAGPNGFTSATPNPQIANLSAVNAGTYTVTATFSGACVATATASRTISVGNPTVNIMASRAGQPNEFVFCASTNVEISLNGIFPSAIAYNWTGPNGFSSTDAIAQINNIQAVNVGTYSLSLTVVGGCIGTATINIYVGNPSTPSVIPSNLSNCPGTSATFNPQNLSNYSSGTTYSWSGPNNFSSTTSNPTISNLQTINAGVYTLTINYPSTRGCASSGSATATANLTIGTPTATALSRLQNSNSTDNYFCVGNNVELFSTFNVSSPAPTVASYSWTGPNGYTSGSAIPVINNFQAINAGPYSVTVTFSGACAGTATATRTIYNSNPSIFINSYTVGATPVFSTSFCPTSSVELRAFPNNYNNSTVTYAWTGPNNFTSTAQFPQITNLSAANSGTYSVTATFAGACVGTATATSIITIGVPSVYADSYTVGGTPLFSTTFCPTSSIELRASASVSNNSSVTYAWAGPNNFTSTAQNPQIANVTASNAGTYTVTATFTGNCAGTSTATRTISVGNPSVFIYAKKVGLQNFENSYTFCQSTNVEFFSQINPSNTQVLAYNWSGPNGFNSTAALPQISNIQATNAGTYTLSLVLGGACAGIVTSTVGISVGNPTAFISTNSNPYQCPGGSITLFASASYGNFDAGTTYSWSGPNNFSSTIRNPSLSNLQAANSGTYTVTANFNSTTGCATGGTISATTTLNIGPPTTNALSRTQGSNSNNSTFCIGGNVEFYTTFNGSTTPTILSYSWTGPNGYTSSSANPIINNFQATNAGTYSVTVIFSGACAGTATATRTIGSYSPSVGIGSYDVGASPVNTSTFCPTTSVELRAFLYNNFNTTATYSWAGPNGFLSSAQNPQISNLSAANSGTYTLSVAFSGGCITTATSTQTITVGSPNVFANARRIGQGNNNAYSFCPGTNIELFVSTNPSNISVASYNWTGPNGFSSTDALPTISNAQAINAGIYTLITVISGACAGTYTSTLNFSVENPALYITHDNFSVQCPGGNISLFQYTSIGTLASGTTYNWTGPNGFSSTQQSPPKLTNLQATNSGIYTLVVNYPSASGCENAGTLTATKKISIGNTAAQILPNQDQTVNVGANVLLNIEILGGTPPFNVTLSNGGIANNFYPNETNIIPFSMVANLSTTITIANITSACGTGTGTGSAVITVGTPCPSSILFSASSTYTSGNVFYQEASNTISTESSSTPILTVNSGAKVTLDAGKAIILQPGFKAETGSVFKAFIDGCGNITNGPENGGK